MCSPALLSTQNLHVLRSTMQQPTQNINATNGFVGLSPKKWRFWLLAPFDTTKTSARLPHKQSSPVLE